MRGTGSDGEFGVAGVCDRHVAEFFERRAGFREERRIAAIARGDHDGYAAAHQAIDFDAERALSAGEPARIEIVTEAEVGAVDQQAFAVLVPLLDAVDGAQHVADFAGAIGADYFQAEQLAARRYAGDGSQWFELEIRRFVGFVACFAAGNWSGRICVPVACDDSGYVRSVTRFVC